MMLKALYRRGAIPGAYASITLPVREQVTIK
jgi:hypothetical protein